MIRLYLAALLFLFSLPVFAVHNFMGYYPSEGAAAAACTASRNAVDGGHGCTVWFGSTEAVWSYCVEPWGAVNVTCAGLTYVDEFHWKFQIGGGCPPDSILDEQLGVCLTQEDCPSGQVWNPITQQCQNPGPPECDDPNGFQGSVEGIGGCHCPEGTYYRSSYDGSGGVTRVCAPQQQCNLQHPGFQGYIGSGETGYAVCDAGSECGPGMQGGMAVQNGINQLVCVPDISGDGGGGGGNDEQGPFGPSLDFDGDGILDSNDPDIDGDGINNENDDYPYDPDPNGNNTQEPPTGGEGGEGEEGTNNAFGSASDCRMPPQSRGDPQLAAIHMQLWINRCRDQENNTDDSVFADSCSSAFQCEGDTFQCAILEAQHVEACAKRDSGGARDAVDDVFEGEGVFSTADLEGQWAADGIEQHSTVDLADSFDFPDGTPEVTGTCPIDLTIDLGGVFGSITVPISQFCQLLEWVGLFVRLAASLFAFNMLFATIRSM